MMKFFQFTYIYIYKKIQTKPQSKDILLWLCGGQVHFSVGQAEFIIYLPYRAGKGKA
jgi:hypothetical protein